ncbi:ImmA/IrrE family metallo-endopeptidase [Corynebacterium diphtheriae]|uniref:ImmA/IrrE family metallo-endopeptidase n=1 Tax=Corynebacterium diphtheriae TaxID=1717 RepID=UPI0035302663
MTPNRKLRSLRTSTASCNPWSLSRIPPLDPTISGVVVKEDEQNPKIYINSNEPEVRQRFTLAHEIGHLVEREHWEKTSNTHSLITETTVNVTCTNFMLMNSPDHC